MLIFIEWNIKEIYYDVRFLATSISISLILLIIFNIIHFSKINYIYYYYLYSYIILLIFVSNFILLYLIRITFAFITFKNEEKDILNSIKNNFQSSQNSSFSKESLKKESICKSHNSRLSSKIVNLHYLQ